MPDNMTPESGKSSIDYMRSLGQPAKLPGVEESARAAQEFPQPIGRKDMPDIRMDISKKEDPGTPIEDALANRMYYRTESLSSELIASAENPHELFTGLRSLERMLEDGNIPQSLSERYTPPRELSLMYERAGVLGIPAEDLLKQGLIKDYNKETGEGVPRKRKFASLALRVDENPIYLTDKDGNYITDNEGRKREVGVNLKYIFGTPEKRAEMAKAYEKAVLELEVRDIMGDHVGLRLNLDFRDNLEGLTEMLHGGRMPKFKAAHLETLFNMPSLAELENNPENHQLGNQVEEAMFLNLVMLNSGTKDKMNDFLNRPGANVLIDRMRGAMDRDEWIGRYIGVVDRWEDDANRELTTYINEPRGPLTQWSNIATFEGKDPSDNFGLDKEQEFIEGTVGKLVGSIEASWIAATMMRVIGAYASEGYVAIPPGINPKTGKEYLLKDKVSLKLGEGRYISSDDTGKFLACMFDLKEGLKGRSSGLKDMIGKIPDMAMNLFDWAQVRVDDVKDEKGDPVRRSVWDAWLGTAGGKAKIDILTGEPTADTTKITKEEPYHRLGDLNFKSLDRDFHGTFTIMQWLMGRSDKDGGLLADARKTEFRFDDDFSLNNLKKKIKYIGICFNPVVLTKGSAQLYTYPLNDEGKEDNGKAAGIIQKNFFRNLMSARMHSASFAMNILGSSSRLLNPKSGAQVEVPTTRLVELFIDQALKKNPEDEKELFNHYIDNNYVLRTSGTMDKVDSVLVNAKFEDKVGKVTGKKS